MCGLFGFLAYGEKLPKDLRRLAMHLGWESTERGTDATGISFTRNGKVQVDKAPVNAFAFKYSLPQGCRAVMGHTRRTTQGQPEFNQNNHPFWGYDDKGNRFSYAHNGILDNDIELQQDYKLPDSNITTDSYVAVQLLEAFGDIEPDTLKKLGEEVQGMFAFTLLDKDDNISIVRNDSPFVIAHFKALEMYVYASTEGILWKALLSYGETNTELFDALMYDENAVEILKPGEGEIWVINSSDGSIDKHTFKPQERWGNWKKYAIAGGSGFGKKSTTSCGTELTDNDVEVTFGDVEYHTDDEDTALYWELLCQKAGELGLTNADMNLLREYGYTIDEIEDSLFDYNPFDMINECKQFYAVIENYETVEGIS